MIAARFCFVLKLLFDQGIKHRAVPFPEGSKWKWFYDNSLPHYFLVLLNSTTLSSVLGVAGGYTAWRAAYKCAKSHKFEYVVAQKPKAAKTKLANNTLF